MQVTRSKYVAPSLRFPFEEPNKQFWDYAKSIEELFPFG